MPTRVTPAPVPDVASTRVLRLALGTAISLWISQAVAWDLSFLAPVVTMFLLAMPLSRPKPKLFIVIVLALTLSIYASFVFLPLLLHQRLVGLLLLSLALFHCFYYTARGGTEAVGTLLTVGIAVTVAVGTVSVDALVSLAGGLFIGASAGAIVALLSHYALPDKLYDSPAKVSDTPPEEKQINLPAARHDAMRSLAVVLPILIWFAISSASAANTPVMIKVAAMGQEVSRSSTRDAARSLIVSTLAGGLAATIAWQVLSVWPSLTMYVLLIAIAGLIFGRKIFEGRGLHSEAATWSYAFLTMIVVLAPAVLDSSFGSAAGAAFYDRLFMFGWATLYAVIAVYVFDAFWKRPES
ncbi:MAG: DUF2955 domain-containing protein [Gammaproteobacteria bacterium]|nr:DUF2955 domain-containing protein [Gammaproteobacteria bacterium]